MVDVVIDGRLVLDISFCLHVSISRLHLWHSIVILELDDKKLHTRITFPEYLDCISARGRGSDYMCDICKEDTAFELELRFAAQASS